MTFLHFFASTPLSMWIVEYFSLKAIGRWSLIVKQLKNVTNSYINGANNKEEFEKPAIFIIFRFKHLILLQIVKFGIVIINADYAPYLPT